MPYQKREDRPDAVRDHLAAHAQDNSRAADNSVLDAYRHDETRAHRVAWAAVGHEYQRDESSGRWVKGVIAGRDRSGRLPTVRTGEDVTTWSSGSMSS